MSQNIKPSIWGPHGWKFMHYVSLGYPIHPTNKEKEHYKTFYESLQYVLPCGKCAQNYAENLKQHPIDKSLDSRDDVIKWVIDIHNKVNTELGKPSVPYEDALNLYLKQSSPITTYGFKLLVLAIILVFVYYLMK